MEKRYFYIIIFFIAVNIAGCQDDDFDQDFAPTYPASGDWYITNAVETTPGVYEDVFHLGYSHLLISNTASMDPDSIWISDEGNFWTYKIKAHFDKATNSITASEATSIALYDGEPYPVKVNITNGKVFPGQGKAPSGVAADSIYLEVAFDDDVDDGGNPYATKFIVSGHRFTGLDEH